MLIGFASTRKGKQLFVYVGDQLFATQTVNEWMRVGHIELSEWQDMDLRKASALSDQIENSGEVTLADEPR